MIRSWLTTLSCICPKEQSEFENEEYEIREYDTTPHSSQPSHSTQSTHQSTNQTTPSHNSNSTASQCSNDGCDDNDSPSQSEHLTQQDDNNSLPLTFTYSYDVDPLIHVLPLPFAGRSSIERSTTASSVPKTMGGTSQTSLKNRANEMAEDANERKLVPLFAFNETSSKKARLVDEMNIRILEGDTGLDYDFVNGFNS